MMTKAGCNPSFVLLEKEWFPVVDRNKFILGSGFSIMQKNARDSRKQAASQRGRKKREERPVQQRQHRQPDRKTLFFERIIEEETLLTKESCSTTLDRQHKNKAQSHPVLRFIETKLIKQRRGTHSPIKVPVSQRVF
eukprot:scaffold8374_cov175-Amphora_coffeaeformis.AAC.25